MTRRRKILLWSAGSVIVLGLLVTLGVGSVLSLSEAEFRQFSQEHEKGLAKLESEIQSRWAAPESHGQGVNTKPANVVPGPKPAAAERVDLAREIGELNRQMKPIASLIYGNNWPFDAREFYLHLPVEAGGAEDERAPLRISEEQKRKFVEDAACYQNGWNRLFAERGQKVESRDLLTTLSTGLQPLLDRTDALLERGDWAWAGLGNGNADHGTDASGYLTMMAILRANLRGERERAGRMLEQAVRLRMIREFQDITRLEAQVRTSGLEALLMAMGEVDALTTDGAARAEALGKLEQLLRGARLTEPQARELRAARALGLDDFLQDRMAAERPRDGAGFDVRLSLAWNRAWIAAGGALIKPAVRDWAEGHQAAYMARLERLEFLDRVSRNAFGFGLSGLMMLRFEPNDDPMELGNSINGSIDTLRLLAAAARYRLAEGRAPAAIGDLVPRYLDDAFLQSANSAWGIIQLPQGLYPERVVTARPTKEEAAYTKALARFRAERGRLPRNAGELASAAGTADAPDYRKYFATLDARTIYFHVTGITLSRQYLELMRKMSVEAESRKQIDELLARIKPGGDRVRMLGVAMVWWEPERFHPERLAAIKGR